MIVGLAHVQVKTLKSYEAHLDLKQKIFPLGFEISDS